MMQAEQNKNTRTEPFIYTAEEAAAAARHELGVGELPFYLSLLLAACFGAVLLARTRMGLSLLPPFSVLGVYAAAVGAWCIFLVYIRIRLRQTAAALQKRSFTLHVQQSGFAVFEFDTSSRYHAAYADITAVKSEQPVICITAPMGRVCLPQRIFTAEELVKLQQKHSR